MFFLIFLKLVEYNNKKNMVCSKTLQICDGSAKICVRYFKNVIKGINLKKLTPHCDFYLLLIQIFIHTNLSRNQSQT